jgi:hypothetical protein
MFEAPTDSRFVDAPVAPSAIVTVPDATDWLADVELVKVAYVPRPAMAEAAPMAATESSSFRDTPDSAERAIKREVLFNWGWKDEAGLPNSTSGIGYSSHRRSADRFGPPLKR